MDLQEGVVALVEMATQTRRDRLGELDRLVVGKASLEGGARSNRGNSCKASSELCKSDHVGYEALVARCVVLCEDLEEFSEQSRPLLRFSPPQLAEICEPEDLTVVSIITLTEHLSIRK